MLQGTVSKRIFDFKIPGGTSRGVLTQKKSWFVEIWDEAQPAIKGIGECSIIPGLSPDYLDDENYEREVQQILNAALGMKPSHESLMHLYEDWKSKPSLFFGLETAMLDLMNGGRQILFESDFTKGKSRIPINGLIWMGDKDFMRRQIDEKLKQGYSCLKMKVGAIGFEQEMEILSQIRHQYKESELTLRVDANGAFSPEEALSKLKQLAALKIHSIEQPIRAGQISALAALCASSPLPIALDEELIGVHDFAHKKALLQEIKPQYIILKPSLHGGLSGCREWIDLAEAQRIPWWITSALEANVGLNAIAQFTATFTSPLHQGLGTGALYTENTPTNLFIEKGFLGYKA